MNDRIIFTNPDGSVGVVIPTGEIPTSEVIAKDVPAGAVNTRLADVTALPADRLFRGAWDDSNPEEQIGVNLAKAKEIAHGLRRAKRDEMFKPYLAVTAKAAQGVPLKANENATDAATAMDTYKTNIDDVAQTEIDAIPDDDAGTPIVTIDDSALRTVLANASLV